MRACVRVSRYDNCVCTKCCFLCSHCAAGHRQKVAGAWLNANNECLPVAGGHQSALNGIEMATEKELLNKMASLLDRESSQVGLA